MVPGQGGTLDGGCGSRRVWILPWRSEEPSSSVARYRRRRARDPPSSRPQSV